jgi:hypothetical protein
VAVEKVDIHKNSMILGAGKWSDAPYKAFIGHPDATFFAPLSAVEYFNRHACYRQARFNFRIVRDSGLDGSYSRIAFTTCSYVDSSAWRPRSGLHRNSRRSS